MAEEERVHPESRAQWRAWLAEYHDRQTTVWVVYWKLHTGKRVLTYEESVEEALCFGWIDGKLNPVDTDRTMIRFTRRKPGSAWARSNKVRVAALTAAGLMEEAGIAAVERAKADGSWTALDAVEALVVPQDLAQALAATPGASATFDAYSASVKKSALAWVTQAKRPQTRAARTAEVVRCAAADIAQTFRVGG